MAGFLSALPVPFGVGYPGLVTQTAEQPQAGWSNWLNNLPRPRRVEEEDEQEQPRPKKKKTRKRRLESGHIILEPDPVIETGVIEVRPAWDVMVGLQQIQQEAEIARLERLRAIALADDEWLMMV